MKKIEKYRKMLFYINIPLVIGIPLFVQFGVPELQKKDLSMLYAILHLTDFFFCFNSILIYSIISKVVTCIKYLPEEHKI